MTKILYIPNGIYFHFYSSITGEYSDIIERVVSAKHHSVEDFVEYLISHVPVSSSDLWLEEHGLKRTDTILRSELEIIYD